MDKWIKKDSKKSEEVTRDDPKHIEHSPAEIPIDEIESITVSK